MTFCSHKLQDPALLDCLDFPSRREAKRSLIKMALGGWGEEGTSRISTLLYIAVTIVRQKFTYRR